MPDTKISALAAVAGTAVAAADPIPIVSGGTTKAIRADNLLDAALLLSADGMTLPATTPAQITAAQNNYSPGVGPFQRWSASAAWTVTGLVAGAAGETRLVWNVGTFPITLSNESASSTAANRFTCVGSSDIVVGAGGLVLLTYSGATSRWLATKVRSDTSEGTLVVRKPGGTAGTNEFQMIPTAAAAVLTNKNSADDWEFGNGTAGQYGVRLGGWNSGNHSQFRNAIEDSVGSGNAWTVTGAGSVGKIYLGGASRASALVFRPDGSGASPDAGITSLATGVIAPTNGTTGGVGSGWFQNTAGEGRLNAAFTRSNTTLTATNVSITVAAGRSYWVRGYLIVSNTVAAEGVKFDFGGGTATATTFDVTATVLAGGSVGAGTQAATSLTGAMNFSTVTGTVRILIEGYLKVNAGGTLILRAAENSTSTGTVTLAAGSGVTLGDTVNL